MMLRVTLRATPRMMLRMMLCVTVPLAHAAAQPLSHNLSCPFLLSTSLVHICVHFWLHKLLDKKVGSFSSRSALGTLLLRLQVAMFELEMRERTFRTSHPRLKLKLQCSSWSCESALRLCSRRWSCCGNALRVQLWRTMFAFKGCHFAAGAL